jgi:Mn2+/Fe2+ NRAMP family transporter
MMKKLFRFFRQLGPGIVVAATAIGASHIVMSPVAGARFGFDLLWVILFAHVLKYHGFEFAPRFTMARSESLLEGYARVPGPRNWPLYLFLLGTILQGVAVLSGVVSVAAAVAYAGIGAFSLPAWSVILATVIVVLLWMGKYEGLDFLNKVMMLVLISGALIAFVAAPPPPSVFPRLFVPFVPMGSIFLLAALLGWMPTGLDVAVWHSLWAMEKEKTWRRLESGEPTELRQKMFRTALFDMRFGYVVSLVLGIVFLCLGAVLLQPRGLVPQGPAVAETLSEIFTTILGAWMYPVFITAAFFAMFSTAYNCMDGFPRAFAETVSLLLPGRNSQRFKKKAYWGFLFTIYILAVAFMTIIPEPVFLITTAGALSLLFAPVYYGLNYYCVTRLVDKLEYRPSVVARVVAIAGILFVSFGALLFLYTEVYLKLIAF